MAPAQVKAQFQEVDVIKDPDGIIIPVTYRMREGKPELTFSVQREFDRDGAIERSAWLRPSHVAAVQRLLEQLVPVLDLHEDRLRAAAREARAQTPR